MRRILMLSSLLLACGPEKAPLLHPIAPLTSTLVQPNNERPVAGTSKPTEKLGGYQGHGATSLSPQIIAKFAPPALPDDLTRHIQAMLDVRSNVGGRISADGKTMYFTWNVTGVNQVWRLDGPNHFPVQMTGGQDVTNVTGIAPDGSFVVVSRDRRGEENPGIYLMSPNGGPLTEVQHTAGVQSQFAFVSDDSRYVYFRANDVNPTSYAIYRYDRTTKKRETVFGNEGIWTVMDHKADGRLLLAKEVGSNMTEIFEWNPTKKVLTPLFGQDEREDYVAFYGANEGQILTVTPKLGEFRRLYSWEKGKFTPISPDLKSDVEVREVDRKLARIFLHVNEGGYTRLQAIDGHTFKKIDLPALPAGDHVIASGTSVDGRYTIIGIDSGRGPLRNYVYDWTAKKLAIWQVPSVPELDATKFTIAKLESFPARDGTKIPMFVWRPEACATAAKPCPIIMMFHGGPEGQTVAGFNRLAQLYVDAGFVFAAPNVRGSDGYGRGWIHADDGPKRLDVITDIEDAGKFARANWGRNGVEPKLGILGGSYGGYSTLIGMTMFAGTYDAGASNVGMSNLVTFLENTAPYRRPLRISEYGDPVKDHDALVKLSPITYVDKVKSPLLILQGASDPRVPAGEAVQIHDALVAKKIPTKLIIFADEGHGTQKRENKVLEIGHTLQFFKEHLSAQ